ncbi:MAG: hypothetical protein N2379_01405 [Verrucomicrobiae bacterium]|nr:hypothetical protein [Verrucomicrobiae bacterium]
MGLLKRKTDPVAERARALDAELGRLEREIQRLEAQLHGAMSQARFRSTAIPGGPTVTHAARPQAPAPPQERQPVLETVKSSVLENSVEPVTTPAHFNEFGVRKYDLVELAQRLKRYFTGPTASNPKLVSYLAAGSIQGPRPLRYEKRVARNRFIALVVVLFIMLLGILSVFLRTS